MSGMHGLEYLRQGRTVSRNSLAQQSLRRHWRIVPQCLPQPTHTTGILRRTKQHLDDRSRGKILAQIIVDFRSRGLHILQNLLQQHIISISQYLHQLVQRIQLIILYFGRNLHQFGRLPLAISIRPFAHHIDVAADRLPIDDRHLAQHQRRSREPLKRAKCIAHTAFQRVDLVDKQHVRNALVRQQLEQRRHRQHASRRRLANHHGKIDHGECATGFIGELDRARAIQHRPRIAKIVAMPQSDLGGRRSVARVRRPLDRRASRLHQRLEQRRLAAAVRPDQSHRAGTSAVLRS